ncbi:hypothetical protein F5Y11DRAFT_363138 [Daldinia sp. FL1419]|nr:hypothetical protein F5Y11DRAFT_363138 [Daldinia sp. FL1419]
MSSTMPGHGNHTAMTIRSFTAFETHEDEYNNGGILEEQSSLANSIVDAVSSPETFKKIWEETDIEFQARQSVNTRRRDSILSTTERGRAEHTSSYSGKTPSAETRSVSNSPRSLLSLSTKSKGNSSSTSPAPGEGVGLPGLQIKEPRECDNLAPLTGDEINPNSFNLVTPYNTQPPRYSLEIISEALFSKEHMNAILNDQLWLERYRNFLYVFRPRSVPCLVHYLDTLKAYRAVEYSNTLIKPLRVTRPWSSGGEKTPDTINRSLMENIDDILDIMTKGDLPAYIVHTWMQTVAVTIKQRVTGRLPSNLKSLSEGLLDVFYLTDPSRDDNPIVLASEEFHRTTQYGAGYVLGRNSRFLRGPGTIQLESERIKDFLKSRKEYCEVVLNYRRDGSPFMNFVMTAPLLDDRGTIRYYITAMIDISGLANECIDFESLKPIVKRRHGEESVDARKDPEHELRKLAEMFSPSEVEIIREVRGNMSRRREGNTEGAETSSRSTNPGRKCSSLSPQISTLSASPIRILFDNYLLVRPFPFLQVLFASPSLRFPGMLQSSFMSRIGGPPTVRQALFRAFADGDGITTKVRWVTRLNRQGKDRWLHCTPLLGSNGAIGVWMVMIIVDNTETSSQPSQDAPSVDIEIDFDGSDTSSCSSDAGEGPSRCCLSPRAAEASEDTAIEDTTIEDSTPGSSGPAHDGPGSATI